MIDSIHKFENEKHTEIQENTEEIHSQAGSMEEGKLGSSSMVDLKMGYRQEHRGIGKVDTFKLKNHMDTVRDGAFLTNLDQAVTVSEDCTIKLWDLRNLSRDETEIVEEEDRHNISSYYTLRGHTGIITKVAADEASNSDGTMFYTAGIEGIIRAWKAPNVDEIDQFGQDCEFSTKLCPYIWEAHPNEIIWDLKHHKSEPMILSAGADDLITLWKTPTQNEIERLLEHESENQRLEDKLFMQSFQLNSGAHDTTETPT